MWTESEVRPLVLDQLGVVAHAYSPSSQEEQDLNVVARYIVSLRLPWDKSNHLFKN